MRSTFSILYYINRNRVKADGTIREIRFRHKLSDEDIRMILAGGMLNL